MCHPSCRTVKIFYLALRLILYIFCISIKVIPTWLAYGLGMKSTKRLFFKYSHNPRIRFLDGESMDRLFPNIINKNTITKYDWKTNIAVVYWELRNKCGESSRIGYVNGCSLCHLLCPSIFLNWLHMCACFSLTFARQPCQQYTPQAKSQHVGIPKSLNSGVRSFSTNVSDSQHVDNHKHAPPDMLPSGSSRSNTGSRRWWTGRRQEEHLERCYWVSYQRHQRWMLLEHDRTWGSDKAPHLLPGPGAFVLVRVPGQASGLSLLQQKSTALFQADHVEPPQAAECLPGPKCIKASDVQESIRRGPDGLHNCILSRRRAKGQALQTGPCQNRADETTTKTTSAQRSQIHHSEESYYT